MKNYQFTAHIERDRETGLYVGYIPNLPGAHTQAESLDELQENLKEVTELCLSEIQFKDTDMPASEYIGTQEVRIAI